MDADNDISLVLLGVILSVVAAGGCDPPPLLDASPDTGSEQSDVPSSDADDENGNGNDGDDDNGDDEEDPNDTGTADVDSGAPDADTGEDLPENVGFEEEIVPIIREECAVQGCHGTNAASDQSFVIGDDGDDASVDRIRTELNGTIPDGEEEIPFVVPEQPDESALYRSVRENPPSGTQPMPKDEADIDRRDPFLEAGHDKTIKAWILEGAEGLDE